MYRTAKTKLQRDFTYALCLARTSRRRSVNRTRLFLNCKRLMERKRRSTFIKPQQHVNQPAQLRNKHGYLCAVINLLQIAHANKMNRQQMSWRHRVKAFEKGGGDEKNRRYHAGSVLPCCTGESDLDMFLLCCNVFSMQLLRFFFFFITHPLLFIKLFIFYTFLDHSA